MEFVVTDHPILNNCYYGTNRKKIRCSIHFWSRDLTKCMEQHKTQRISKLKWQWAGHIALQIGTGVKITYGKSQRETATCQRDRRRRQDCRESLDAGGISHVTMEINWRPKISSGQLQADMLMMMSFVTHHVTTLLG